MIELLQPKAIERGNKLESEYAGPCPETIRTDPTRLRQILTNLAANALKFTERGMVKISVQMGLAKEGKPRIQFNVIDTGIGMTSEQLKSLFEPFTQANVAHARNFGGTGLGLTISKQFAQLLGGDISVTSQAGAGSTFTVEVDAGELGAVRMLDNPRESLRQVQEQPTARDEPRFSGRILLAEDEPTNQEVICLYLREAGAEVSVADNGRVACEMVAAAAKAGMPFHLVVMDMGMPEMDGCQATLALRNAGQKMPIIALTGNALSSDRDHCLSRLQRVRDQADRLAAANGDDFQLPSRQGCPAKAPAQSASAPRRKTAMADLDESARELQAALASNDRVGLAQLAHALKETASASGHTDLAAAAAELEQSATGTSPPETVKTIAERLLEFIHAPPGNPAGSVIVSCFVESGAGQGA